jgi:hypothetical protein
MSYPVEDNRERCMHCGDLTIIDEFGCEHCGKSDSDLVQDPCTRGPSCDCASCIAYDHSSSL